RKIIRPGNDGVKVSQRFAPGIHGFRPPNASQTNPLRPVTDIQIDRVVLKDKDTRAFRLEPNPPSVSRPIQTKSRGFEILDKVSGSDGETLKVHDPAANFAPKNGLGPQARESDEIVKARGSPVAVAHTPRI